MKQLMRQWWCALTRGHVYLDLEHRRTAECWWCQKPMKKGTV